VIVCGCMKLEPHGVRRERPARQPRPLDRALALFDHRSHVPVKRHAEHPSSREIDDNTWELWRVPFALFPRESLEIVEHGSNQLLSARILRIKGCCKELEKVDRLFRRFAPVRGRERD
jgi:hypothetical protein